jgi:hypothetical protein
MTIAQNKNNNKIQTTEENKRFSLCCSSHLDIGYRNTANRNEKKNGISKNLPQYINNKTKISACKNKTVLINPLFLLFVVVIICIW